MFDQGKTGLIDRSKIATILNTLGHTFDDEELEALLEAQDVDSKAFLNYKSCIHYRCIERSILFAMMLYHNFYFFPANSKFNVQNPLHP